jgi:hypothetical protein
MPIIGAETSQATQVRWIAGGTSLATGSTYYLGPSVAPIPTRAGDVILFTYVNSGSPTLTSSTSGLTWATQYTTSGGSAPQPRILLGYGASAGITSFTVSGTASGGGGYGILLISGLKSASPGPVITTAQAVWSSGSSGGTTGTLNLSGNTQVLLVGAATEFGAQTFSSGSTASGAAVNQRTINSVSRTICTVTSQSITSSSTETMTLNFAASQTGGLLVLALAHA